MAKEIPNLPVWHERLEHHIAKAVQDDRQNLGCVNRVSVPSAVPIDVRINLLLYHLII